MVYVQKALRVLFRAYVKAVETSSSKKFLVFLTSCFLLYQEKLSPEIWLPIALVTLGAETLLDFKYGGNKKPFDASPEENIK